MDFFIQGLEVYGHHGVGREEKVLGQRLYFDVRLTTNQCKAALTDKVEDVVDYTEVLDLIEDLATSRSFSLLEAMAYSVGEAILKKFPVDSVRVQVTKPHPPVACALTGVSAAVELGRGDAAG